jgi:poly-gamma-glutamate capsule biosynthesis protein CapA/YwtB (metallophosphatase superfamily)
MFILNLQGSKNKYIIYYIIMKILFFGDCMFGRNNNPFIANPFFYVEEYIKAADIIIFNLETVISNPPLDEKYRVNKVFNYQSNGNQLMTLINLTYKPIIASISNNHSLDYGPQGLLNTKEFLDKIKIKYAIKKRKLELKNIIFISASDHCGCENINLWKQYIWIIDYTNITPIIQKLKKLKKLKKLDKNKFIIFSIHWGSNWLDKIPENMTKLGQILIDNGVNIVFGHSAHHIPPIPVKKYKNGLIIYGLGDFINDYSIKDNYKSDEALMCLYDTISNKYNLIPIKREFIQRSSIPTIMK